MSVPGNKDRFREATRLTSGWVVALLAILAAWLVLHAEGITSRMRTFWYVLVSIAVLRAAYRTWLVVRNTRK